MVHLSLTPDNAILEIVDLLFNFFPILRLLVIFKPLIIASALHYSIDFAAVGILSLETELKRAIFES